MKETITPYPKTQEENTTMRNEEHFNFFNELDDEASDNLADGKTDNDMLYAIGCMLRSIAYSLSTLADQHTLSSDELDSMEEDPDSMEPDEK